jgi:dihydrodipicolinate synthase/N-acetylneuraminate lyase
MGYVTAPRGLIADLVTPLKENGEIDGPGLGRHLDRVLPHVHAVWIASPYAGEGFTLSALQREDLLDKTLVVVRSRMPLLVWVTQETEDETKKTFSLLEKRLEARNYHGPVFWVDTPLHYHSNRGLSVHYHNLCTTASKPWVLHNDPDLVMRRGRPFKRNNIRTAILKNLTRIEQIQGLIFFGSLERAGNYHKAARKRPEFRVYDGDESHFLTYPSMSGVVSAGANLAPNGWRKVVEASLNMANGREDYPDRLQQLWETGSYLKNLLENYRPFPAAIIKGALSEMGIIESPRCTTGAKERREDARAVANEMKNRGDWEA